MQSYACPECGTFIEDEDVLALGICISCGESLENSTLSLDQYSLDDIATLLSGHFITKGDDEAGTTPQPSPVNVSESAASSDIPYFLNQETGRYEYKTET
jgi:DNA-directed RNA polymerase subunit RPC12/RpoP